MIYRDEERTDVARGRYSHLRALFPLYRSERDNHTDDGGTLALLDGMFPRDAGVRETYAPLWEMYAWDDGPTDAPSWSAAWGAVTHADGTTTYPWHFE